MMIKGMVSVIVTCYNQEQYISKTLQSVLDQTYKNWECIIVDDGSTDGSALVIKRLIKNEPRCTYVYQENKGVSIARNTGFKLAKGVYIQFLDGDDTLLPAKLEKQLNVFQEHTEIAICICDHQFYLEKEKIYKYHDFENIKTKPLEQLLYKWHNGSAFANHAPLYKRDLWNASEIPFPEDYKDRCEDWVFNVLIALKNEKYYWLDEVLCNYHIASSNFTGDQLMLVKAAIKAAYYLNPLIPITYQPDFIDNTIENNIKMYLENERQNILKSSRNWRIAHTLSKPIIKLLHLMNKLKPNH